MPSHHLDNGVVHARVSAVAGGRLLSFALAGKPNFLLIDEAAGDYDTAPDAASGHVPYQGHEVWIGPQRDWWAYQDVNPARAAAKAAWPPDPWLSLAKYTLVEKKRDKIVLDGPASPVSGIQLRKRYALVAGKPDSLRLDAEATNRSGKLAGRDIWFNTRVPAHTMAYVPVAAREDVRIEPAGALHFTLGGGLLSLDLPMPGDAPRKGKLFAQPSHGWLAAFRDGQALVIQFAHQPRAAIHPAQGQVELYQDADARAADKGMLELEVHAPYVELAPGAAMRASEHWTILPYDGPATRDAHLEFLRRHAAHLGISLP
ncbi:DUF4380 domain-containing protein [Massilia arenae]|uniref:DUF4380 domain-containing protein n=1 Tax=Massilia arenae TaxID=2603288 RepID=UPI001E414DB3|nr:DUF4380 domain-containing protein [Massilia arenae]